LAGILLLSLPRKAHKISHQQQIKHKNHDLAHACATSLVAKARVNTDKENCPWTTTQVITQVEGEFRAHGFKVVLLKPTINRCICDDMIGTKPLSRGYKELLPQHALNLLVLAEELFLQITQWGGGCTVLRMIGSLHWK
jgi:hypothetical protein